MISAGTATWPTNWISTGTTAATDPLTITADGTGSHIFATPDYVWYPEDKHAKLQRVLPPREFNKYINASDLIEEFIKFAGVEGLKAGQVLQLPMDLFIKWLVIRACEEDQEEPNVTLALPAPRQQPRCLGCGQFMQVPLVGLMLHAQRCAEFYFKRREQLLDA